jgi:hypothetical protein
VGAYLGSGYGGLARRLRNPTVRPKTLAPQVPQLKLNMRLAAVTLLITALVIAATASKTAARPSAAACGSDYWPLKTFSDPKRKKVNLTPKDTTLAAITSPVHPQPTPTTRDTPFELQVWRLTAQITEFKREGDSDIHLIFFDAGTYGIAEMPAAACVPKKLAPAKRSSTRARSSRPPAGKPRARGIS